MKNQFLNLIRLAAISALVLFKIMDRNTQRQISFFCSGLNSLKEEEEDDDENEADLDKYDLSADEFEVETLKAKIAARKAALASATNGSPPRSESKYSSE